MKKCAGKKNIQRQAKRYVALKVTCALCFHVCFTGRLLFIPCLSFYICLLLLLLFLLFYAEGGGVMNWGGKAECVRGFTLQWFELDRLQAPLAAN